MAIRKSRVFSKVVKLGLKDCQADIEAYRYYRAHRKMRALVTARQVSRQLFNLKKFAWRGNPMAREIHYVIGMTILTYQPILAYEKLPKELRVSAQYIIQLCGEILINMSEPEG